MGETTTLLFPLHVLRRFSVSTSANSSSSGVFESSSERAAQADTTESGKDCE